jgi:hypothetical protein
MNGERSTPNARTSQKAMMWYADGRIHSGRSDKQRYLPAVRGEGVGGSDGAENR